MGRQNGEASVASSSSIALLQERFRELQRIREKRQEKELLKLFSSSDSERSNSSRNSSPPSMHFDDQQHQTSKLTFQPELDQMTLPHKAPALQDSSLLSLRLNSSQTNPDFRAIKGTPTSLWPNSGSSSRNFENPPDVDTSLHL